MLASSCLLTSTADQTTHNAKHHRHANETSISMAVVMTLKATDIDTYDSTYCIS